MNPILADNGYAVCVCVGMGVSMYLCVYAEGEILDLELDSVL